MIPPIAGLLLIVSDKMTALPQRGWSPWVAALAALVLAGGAAVAVRIAVGGGSAGDGALGSGPAGDGAGLAAAWVSAGLFAAASVGVCVGVVRTASAARAGEATNLSLAGWALFVSPLLPLSGVITFVVAAVVVVALGVARTRDVLRRRLLIVLSTLLDLGRPLPPSVDAMIASKLAKFRMRRRLVDLSNHLRSGLGVVDALDASRLLRADQIAPLRAAELCGTLPEEMRRAAAVNSGRPSSFQNRLEQSASYLYAVALALVTVLTFTALVIIPKLLETFRDFGMSEMGPGMQVIENGPLRVVFTTLVGGAAAATLAAAAALRLRPAGLPTWVLRALPKRVAGPYVLRVLSVPAAAGRAVEPVVKSAALASRTEYWRDLWAGLHEALSSGLPVSEALLGERLVSGRDAAVVKAAGGRRVAALMRRAADVVTARQEAAVTLLGNISATLVLVLLAILTAAYAVALFEPLSRLVRILGNYA